jgi:hypothetical protein
MFGGDCGNIENTEDHFGNTTVGSEFEPTVIFSYAWNRFHKLEGGETQIVLFGTSVVGLL